MNYELASELWSAGFVYTERALIGHEKEGSGVPIPTLSELIESVGKNFASLTNGKVWNPPAEWEWRAGAFTEPVAANKGAQYSVEGRGTTPEEAVARLWLALNKPNG